MADTEPADADDQAQETHAPAPFWLLARSKRHFTAHPLSAWAELQRQADVEVWAAFTDPSNNPSYPGWPLRNLLLLAAKRWGCQSLRVICVRDSRGHMDVARSLHLTVQIPTLPDGWEEPSSKACPEAVGWEASAVTGKPGPRLTNLGPSMDPRLLAESAVDLNVSLMRWRAAPELGMDRLREARCLLLGAGTLGCAVARTLLGWGVRTVSFVDNSRVAFSNPVRQSLYEFQDCTGGGAPKAAAAAAKLRDIFPSVRSEGVQLCIPMPGHPLSGEADIQKVHQEFLQLEQLVLSHDVLFLLMDTRESRWLPTLLAAAHGKLAINAALGFDSFLVMRHGAAPREGSAFSTGLDQPGCRRLGCYFCNDVVAPVDSTVDRTLDQQCTVARPGLAPMAGSVAVELMAATLQHPDGVHAPTGDQGKAGTGSTGSLPLGLPPHMVRGQLNGFSQMCLTGEAYRQCTACSPAVVDRYQQHGWDFVLEALQAPKVLEDLTGLTELHASTAAYDPGCDDSDDDAEPAAPTSADADDGDDVWTSI